jgi:probable rRNA maturation factor
MISVKVQCVFKTKIKLSISPKRLQKLTSELVKHFSKNKKLRKALPSGEEFSFLTLVFVSTGQSKALNLRFRKKNYATDVLSFSEPNNHSGLGELILCPQVLKKQAKEHKHSFKKELDYMIIHGFLHLLGYDHEKSRREELKMMALQDKLFSKHSK